VADRANSLGSTKVMTMSDGCYFCDGGADVLEQHHIVPRRHGGSDESENLVDLCPTCHQKLERLYDKRFYDEIGVNPSNNSRDIGLCGWNECLAEGKHLLKAWNDMELVVCSDHKECRKKYCDNKTVSLHPMNGGVSMLCEEHRTCEHNGCESDRTRIILRESTNQFSNRKEAKVYCPGHTPEDDEHYVYKVRWDDE